MGRVFARMGTLAFGAVAMVSLAACYEHTYDVGRGAPHGRVVYEEWRHHWIAGLISPDHMIAIEDVCPSGNATVHQEQTFLNGLVAALTSGIYSPTTVEVRCSDGRRADLEFSAEEVETMVIAPDFLEWVRERAPDRAAEVEAALADS